MSGKGSGLTKPMKLSADLADIVGKKEASRAECVKQLWAYLKKNNLQVCSLLDLIPSGFVLTPEAGVYSL